MIFRILFGGYLDFSVYGALLNVAGALLGLCTMIYCLRSKIKEKFNKFSRLNSFFLFSGFLVAWIDYRLLEVFMIGVPFNEERIWVFRDLLIVPFLGLLFSEVIPYLGEKVSKALRRVHSSSSTARKAKAKPNLIIAYTLIFIALSGWISVSFSRDKLS